jgi:hypothetical protein
MNDELGFTLVHHRDGKGNSQSDSVYIKYSDSYDVDDTLLFDGSGYGATAEDALDDFKLKLTAAICKLLEVKEKIDSATVDSLVEVDCLGNILKERK